MDPSKRTPRRVQDYNPLLEPGRQLPGLDHARWVSVEIIRIQDGWGGAAQEPAEDHPWCAVPGRFFLDTLGFCLARHPPGIDHDRPPDDPAVPARASIWQCRMCPLWVLYPGHRFPIPPGGKKHECSLARWFGNAASTSSGYLTTEKQGASG